MDIDAVKKRLEMLGYEHNESEDNVIQYLIEMTAQTIKHKCNISEIPECLNYVWCDMVCGEFLGTKLTTGKLESMQVNQIATKIKEGDTEVTFAEGTDPQKRLNSFFKNMANGNGQLIKHRRLRWSF